MEEKKLSLMIPGAIVVAGIIIAGAVFYSNRPDNSPDQIGDSARAPDGVSKAVDNIRPVTANDHIRGNIDAPVIVVEFSDLECPFCRRFHPTMQQIVENYKGQVAWVYRHFPLDNLHSKARKEAEATECAAELGGNDAFWSYTDRLFEIAPSNNLLDLAELPNVAEYIGLDRTAFETCLTSGRFKDKIASNLEDATNSGGQGTPYSIVIAKNGTKSVIPGALQYEQVKQIIDEALSK